MPRVGLWETMRNNEWEARSIAGGRKGACAEVGTLQSGVPDG